MLIRLRTRLSSSGLLLRCLCLLNITIHAKNSPSFPYCNQLLNEQGFQLYAPLKHESLHYVIYEPELPESHDNCAIANDNSLRIEFERNTKVSAILIEETLLSANKTIDTITASLCSGQCSASTLFECKPSDERYESPDKKLFFKYSCSHHRGSYGETGVDATSMEIKSAADFSILDLRVLKKEGFLALLVEEMPRNSSQPMGCLPPGLYEYQTLKPHKEYYSSLENVTIECQTGRSSSRSHAQLTCENGSWLGYTPSECTEIAIGTIQGSNTIDENQVKPSIKDWKKPPNVEHAVWNITVDDLNEAIYSCIEGYYLANNSTGQAIYNQETDEWDGEIECQKIHVGQEESSVNLVGIIGGVVVAVVFLMAVGGGIYLYRNRNRPNNQAGPTANIEPQVRNDNGYEIAPEREAHDELQVM